MTDIEKIDEIYRHIPDVEEVETFDGQTVNSDRDDLLLFNDEYFLSGDSEEFLEHLSLTAEEILIQMGAR